MTMNKDDSAKRRPGHALSMDVSEHLSFPRNRCSYLPATVPECDICRIWSLVVQFSILQKTLWHELLGIGIDGRLAGIGPEGVFSIVRNVLLPTPER